MRAQAPFASDVGTNGPVAVAAAPPRRKRAVASGARSMTYERSYTGCIRPVLGRGGPLQPSDIKTTYWIFPTLE